MKFIQLNGRKVLLRLFINLSIYSMVALIWYGIMKKQHDPPDVTWIMLKLVYGFGMIWFLIFYFAGQHAFRISRKLFALVSSLSIFDNNLSFVGYFEKGSKIFYTRESLCGYIDGYPVIVSFDLATGKGQTSKLIFDFITTKFKRPYTEQLSIPLNWLRGYEPVGDVRKEVTDFAGILKSKSSAISSFEAVVAEKYSTLVLNNGGLKI